ncbi:MAG: beta-lactamase family protein [Nitrospiraceae bacterium]|nr:beta-lactamase family protein [Nitrospiraceae bacterium]
MAMAVQVEAGRLKWTDTLGELFPELAASMRPEYRQRTVLEVLGFRAGLLRLDLFADFNDAPVNPGSLTSQRLDFARWLLEQPPINVPGTTSAYSNASYVLAGAIVERASSRPFEQTLQDTVLTPLGLNAALGLPQTVSPDQPAAHIQLSPGVFAPIAPSRSWPTSAP